MRYFILLLFCLPAQAQDLIINGIILDFETGKRVENVKVAVLFGANFNDLSKSDGHFYLTVPGMVHRLSDSIRLVFQHKDYEMLRKTIAKDNPKQELFLGDVVLIPKVPIIISGRVTYGNISVPDIKISIYSNFIKNANNRIYIETEADGRFRATLREDDLTYSRRVNEFYLDFTDLRKQYVDSLNVVYKIQEKRDLNIVLKKAP